MDLITWLYLIDVASNIAVVLIVGAVLLLAALIINIIIYMGRAVDTVNRDYAKETNIISLKYIKTILPILCTVVIIASLIPSQKTMYLMLGATTAEKIAENPTIKDTGAKVLEIVNRKLDEYLQKESKWVF